MATFIANGSRRLFKVRATVIVANGKRFIEDYGLRSDGKVLRRLVSAHVPGEATVTFTTGYALTGARFKNPGKVTLDQFVRYVATRPGVSHVDA